MTEQSPLSFPCDFPIKIVGLSTDAFEAATLGIIHEHFPTLPATAFAYRYSQANKYLSITVTVIATSQQQLDAVYFALTNCPEVMMAL